MQLVLLITRAAAQSVATPVATVPTACAAHVARKKHSAGTTLHKKLSIRSNSLKPSSSIEVIIDTCNIHEIGLVT